MGKINAEWHLQHPMPPKPSPKQRAQWHYEHALNCGCREITASIAELLKAHGFDVPKSRAPQEQAPEK